MTAYHQMGHDSKNLLEEPSLNRYRGAILSPVNYAPMEVQEQIHLYSTDAFEMIFDPQLYRPNIQRGHLPEWSHFPQDVDTADLSSIDWWQRIIDALATLCGDFRPDALCSPTIVPRTFTNDYYALNARIARMTARALQGSSVDILQTVIVNLPDLVRQDASAEIASIVSGAEVSRVYLCLRAESEPRRELQDTEDIKSAMNLIRLLEGAGIQVLVGSCSSDLILWKAAGATACATGKFFNLRRFTISRWEPQPTEGGGQLPYWFEESLMAFLRESDLVRIRGAGLLSAASQSNPYGQEILQMIESDDVQRWLRLSWRQYLYWFMDFESRLESGDTSTANEILKRAEKNWLDIDDQQILMEEARNDGSWLRSWRRAVVEAFRNT